MSPWEKFEPACGRGFADAVDECFRNLQQVADVTALLGAGFFVFRLRI